MSFLDEPLPSFTPLRDAIRLATREDEALVLNRLLPLTETSSVAQNEIQVLAAQLVKAVRAKDAGASLDHFLHEYQLSSQEGVTLMCLAEALLRIPDAHTADALIRDKLGDGDWAAHLGRSDSFLVNASTWGLILTGKIIGLDRAEARGPLGMLGDMAARVGEPIIRQALRRAMRFVGQQFVHGETIEEGLRRAKTWEAKGYCFSFDMLGEAARTQSDADAFLNANRDAIKALANHPIGSNVFERHGVSVKLSALHPRYEFSQRERVISEITPRLLELAQLSAAAHINLCIDAEESDRLDLSLDLIEMMALHPSLKNWQGLGLAVQAYQKRALPVLNWLADLAQRSDRRLMVRLVKGAYWDSEIKHAQESGQSGFPVFTRKANTDLSYLACVEYLLANPAAFYPQFATHNAHTVASVLVRAKGRTDFEFQRLHGMGEALYAELVEGKNTQAACRIYAPIGGHESLLPYLVRRLLENGANSSFVHRLLDEAVPIEQIIRDPVSMVRAEDGATHPRISLPRDLYLPDRLNSQGMDLTDPLTLVRIKEKMDFIAQKRHQAAPIVNGQELNNCGAKDIHNPARRSHIIGEARDSSEDAIEAAITIATAGHISWDAKPVKERADILRRAADLLEADRAAFIALAVCEAGKTLPDALAELREAVDFCRYYSSRLEESFAPRSLPGPVGEENILKLAGRGVFLCISPWNFPLAIFMGQVVAALAAGNAIIAKPAEQTPLIAARAVRLLHRAGVPTDVLHFLPGPGETVGTSLTRDPRIVGVAFTGGTDTARIIHRSLANREGPIATLIAETGGLNAMIVDSSALPDQVVADVMRSAFNAAGQRCSAQRLLFVQQDAADKIIPMLAGAMAELRVGDPSKLSTDVGPVIDAAALTMLEAYSAALQNSGRLIAKASLPPDLPDGYFFPPQAFEIEGRTLPMREVFGPILHVVRYAADKLDAVIDSINNLGYGLTLGVHSRINATIERVRHRARVGNIYVNRNMIGAVVGVQPFGGEGLSGTGPKAGGPYTLARFAVERTVSIDTTAAGGNAALLTSLGD